MKKNDEIEILIEDMGEDGLGIGHLPLSEGGTFTVFVKDAVLGDRVRAVVTKVKKHYAYAKMLALLAPGAYRVEPVCPVAARCGGCSMMQLDYTEQLRLKERRVSSCLSRIGKIETPEKYALPIVGMEHPYRFRNKMQFPVGVGKNGEVQMGFYAGRTHSIIDQKTCAIGHPVNTYVTDALRELFSAWRCRYEDIIYDETLHKGLIRHVLTRVGFETGELMVCLVINGRKLPDGCDEELTKALDKALDDYHRDLSEGRIEEGPGVGEIRLTSLSCNINREKTNRILGDTTVTVSGNDRIAEVLGGNRFFISPQSFFQVNPVQTEKLYAKAVAFAGLTKEETVWDMYCGIGTITLALSRSAKCVYGVEIVPQAIEDARENAAANGVTNVEFFTGKAEEVIPELYAKDPEKYRADVVVVDPPRKGCDPALLDPLLSMSPERIVYVSCDPATLARDIAYLSDGGYELKAYQPFDQFCHSSHVECVSLLQRMSNTRSKEKDMRSRQDYIEVYFVE